MNKITIQKGRATQVIVYVNWGDKEILSAAEYETRLEEETKLAAADTYDFGQWLYENYSAAEVWDMNEEEKEEVKTQWFEYCRECMKKELCYERRELT